MKAVNAHVDRLVRISMGDAADSRMISDAANRRTISHGASEIASGLPH